MGSVAPGPHCDGACGVAALEPAAGNVSEEDNSVAEDHRDVDSGGQAHGGVISGMCSRQGDGRRRPPAPGVIIAILIIAAGVLLFLDNLGLFHIYNIWRL